MALKTIDAKTLKTWLDNNQAVLVDVRTAGEWEETGVADLSASAKKPITLSWRTQPGMLGLRYLFLKEVYNCFVVG